MLRRRRCVGVSGSTHLTQRREHRRLLLTPVLPSARSVVPQQQRQPFNGLFSRTTRVSRYQKGKTNLDFTGARDSEWQWHQLGQMQVCTSLQTDNHASNPPLSFLQAGCPSCRPTNGVKALKAQCHNRRVFLQWRSHTTGARGVRTRY